MGDKRLDQYLNAHLAGSVGALELIDALERRAPGASQEAFVRRLRSEIESSQATLHAIMQQVGAEDNRLEQAAAWLGEKFARARLAAFDFGSLDRSAIELFAAVDRQRIAAAVAAFTPGA